MSDTASKASATASVLEEMTASIIDRKAAKGAQLTPVGNEPRAPQALPVTNASFPNDQPAEAILQRIGMIREQWAIAEQALQAVEVLLGVGPGTTIDPAAVQRAREAAADARHKAKDQPETDEAAYDAALAVDLAASVAQASPRSTTEVLAHMDQKAIEAQAAVFSADDGWVCPTHGQFKIETSRKGRKYRTCQQAPACPEFEKL